MADTLERMDFDWQVHQDAAALMQRLVQLFTSQVPFAENLASRMLSETGTRLHDWVDHLCVPRDLPEVAELPKVGFQSSPVGSEVHWTHDGGIFPLVRVVDSVGLRLCLKVESVVDFLSAHQVDADINGLPLSPLRTARIAENSGHELWVIQRHGCESLEAVDVSADSIAAALMHSEALTLRRREFDHSADGFQHARDLVARAKIDLGVDWACDLFFAAERRYWQSRNRAAQVQKGRQDRLGLGWANHDHHTYRSSRQHFTRLIRLLEDLGFACRERFYGGAEAGWGAQVLQQPVTGIVIFADVDLTPEEVMGDFAHDGLEPRAELGTVGLWCKLHGEAMLQAGMHHLECQFDFQAARDQLARQGIQTMAPFSDMPHLKQAFTKGEVWSVSRRRIEAALADGTITAQQAEKFSAQGSIGSHLEILERNGGYKGFNQSGISEIIRETDPRRAT